MPEVIRSLVRLGLEPPHSKVYVNLWILGPSPAGRVAEAAGLSRPLVYKALDDLVGMGFAHLLMGRPAKYESVSPELVLGHLRNTAASQLQTIEGAEPGILKALKELRGRPLEEPHGPTFDVLEGCDAIQARARQLVTRAEQRLDFLLSHSREVDARIRSQVLHMIGRRAEEGIPVRIVLGESGEGRELNLGQMKKAFDLRIARGPDPGGLLLSGSTEVLLQAAARLGNGSGHRGPIAVWSDAPALVNTLALLFDGFWNDAAPSPSPAGTSPLLLHRPEP